MDAYYYAFYKTGVPEIDRILSAVACAGKEYHNTECWNDDSTPYPGHVGSSPAEWIQNAANDAAKILRENATTDGRRTMNIIQAGINALIMLRRIDDHTSTQIQTMIEVLEESLAASTQLNDVLIERGRQFAKWGEHDHDPITWSAILTEECGEFAQAALHHRFGGHAASGLREEAVQCAAVALQIVEYIDRQASKPVPCAVCDRGDFQLGHADGCPQNAEASRARTTAETESPL